jgi:hypothetical protein
MSTNPMQIFVGWDSREPLAFSVLVHSLLQRTSRPVTIRPLVQAQLRAAHLYTREPNPLESTEFSLTRFLVPALSDYNGFSLFMDCDMLAQADIGDLWLYVLAHPGKAVYVCPHDYTPKDGRKFLGQRQTAYPRKNWSSLMIFDNTRCKSLTPEYVNTATPLDLHRFAWCPDDAIGYLPLDWNWLVGEYETAPDPKVLHYTLGGPWFHRNAHFTVNECHWIDEWNAWWNEFDHLRSSLSIAPVSKHP